MLLSEHLFDYDLLKLCIVNIVFDVGGQPIWLRRRGHLHRGVQPRRREPGAEPPVPVRTIRAH